MVLSKLNRFAPRGKRASWIEGNSSGVRTQKKAYCLFLPKNWTKRVGNRHLPFKGSTDHGVGRSSKGGPQPIELVEKKKRILSGPRPSFFFSSL